MLAQALEIMCPGVPYTSDGTTWESVIFDNGIFTKPIDSYYEYTLYKLMNVEAIKQFREERNALLDKSDKYMTMDYPLQQGIEDWKEYRQALRDLPRTARPTLDEDGKLTGVEWPVIPGQ
jgi:hypothetical protein